MNLPKPPPPKGSPQWLQGTISNLITRLETQHEVSSLDAVRAAARATTHTATLRNIARLLVRDTRFERTLRIARRAMNEGKAAPAIKPSDREAMIERLLEGTPGLIYDRLRVTAFINPPRPTKRRKSRRTWLAQFAVRVTPALKRLVWQRGKEYGGAGALTESAMWYGLEALGVIDTTRRDEGIKEARAMRRIPHDTREGNT